MFTPTAVLGIALTIPLLALGGVTPDTLLGSIAAVAFALLSLRRDRPFGRFGREAGMALIAISVLALVPLLQLVPLPAAVLRAISPNGATAWAATDALGHTHGLHPVSLDLPGTWFSAATALAVLAFYLVAQQHASTRGGRVRLARAIAAAITAFGFVALLHGVFGVEALYGIHETGHVQLGLPIHPSLVNPNHASAVLAIAPPLFIGFAMEAKTPGERALHVTGAVFTAALCAMTLSRGGVAILAAEACAMLAYGVARRQQRRSRLRLMAIAGASAAVIVGLVAHVALERFRAEVVSGDVSKLKIAFRALDVVRAFAWTGAGRGSFAAVFPRYEGDLQQNLTVSHARFANPESWPVQLGAEIGVLATGIVCAVLLVAVLGRLLVNISRPIRFGSLTALGGLCLHDLFDFSLEYVGCALLAVGLLAIATAPDDVTGRKVEGRPFPLRATLAVAGVSLAVALSFGLRSRGTMLDEDEQRLRDRWVAGRLASAQGEIAAAIARHPVAPYPALVDAVASSNRSDAGARYLQAVKLAPTQGAVHYWFGRWLLSTGRKPQAWAEFREARRLSPSFAQQAIQVMMLAGAELAELQAFASEAHLMDELSVRLEGGGRLADAESNDALLVETAPPAVEARLRQIARWKKTDRAKANAGARALVDLARTEPRAWSAVATTCVEPPDCAERLLDEGLHMVGEDPLLLEELARAQARRLGMDASYGTLERLTGALARIGAPPDRALAVRAELEMSSGRWAAAIRAYLDAAAVAAAPVRYLETAARIAEDNHQWQLARDAYERLMALVPDLPGYKMAAERVSQAQSAAALPGAVGKTP